MCLRIIKWYTLQLYPDPIDFIDYWESVPKKKGQRDNWKTIKREISNTGQQKKNKNKHCAWTKNLG